MSRKPRSNALEAVHEAMSDLHAIGAIDDARLRHYDELCRADQPEPHSVASSSAALTFAVFKDDQGRWWWQLKLPNGELVAVSAMRFRSKRACIENIETMRHLECALVEG